ncbi:MAG: PqqD family protein [Bacteroidetes bacterium]|nr:PqqD family protein [Bacteroidota bacterium]MCL6099555.1 PqqD family protein [Bacteroidota bacterium]
MPLSFRERRKILKGKNALELTPVRMYSYETDLDSRVTVIIPKFKKKFIVKYFVPMMKSPDVKLKLDEYGSFVWLNMDGESTVGTISKRMMEKFGDGFQEVENRISRYITQLYEQRLITFTELLKEGE